MTRRLFTVILWVYLLDTTNAQIEGLCACTPPYFNVTFDFGRTCAQRLSNGGIQETSCESMPQDLVPVVATGAVLSLIGQNGRELVGGKTFWGGNWRTGDSIHLDAETISLAPVSLEIVIEALSASREKIVQTSKIFFNNDCGVFPVIAVGDSIGWLVFTGLKFPTDSVCPTACLDTSCEEYPSKSYFIYGVPANDSLPCPSNSDLRVNNPECPSPYPPRECREQPPPGCAYPTNRYTINREGNCCRTPCIAVDAEGNECILPVSSPPANSGAASYLGRIAWALIAVFLGSLSMN